MRVEPLARIVDAGERGAALGDRLAHRPLEERDEQVVLAAEVEIDGAGGHAGGAGDVGHLRLEEAVAGEHLGRGLEDGVALVDDRGLDYGPRQRGGRRRHGMDELD